MTAGRTRPRGGTSSKAALTGVVAQLNARQGAYLAALSRFDLQAEESQRARSREWFASREPARLWRAIKYGPRLDPEIYPDPPLRAALRAQGLVSQGSGSTWSSLERAGLVETSIRTERLLILGRIAKVEVLHVALTRSGRKAGRALLPPIDLPKRRDAETLSASAWRVLLYALGGVGAARSTVEAWWCTGGTPPGPLVLQGITKNLARRGLTRSVTWSDVAVTEAGTAFAHQNSERYFELYPYSRRWVEIYQRAAE